MASAADSAESTAVLDSSWAVASRSHIMLRALPGTCVGFRTVTGRGSPTWSRSSTEGYTGVRRANDLSPWAPAESCGSRPGRHRVGCVGNHDAIVPSIYGGARQHGINTILVDEREPIAHGFQV